MFADLVMVKNDLKEFSSKDGQITEPSSSAEHGQFFFFPQSFSRQNGRTSERVSPSRKFRTATEATACPSSVHPPVASLMQRARSLARSSRHSPSVCASSSSRATRTHFLRRYATVRPPRGPRPLQPPLPRRTTGDGGLGHWLQF